MAFVPFQAWAPDVADIDGRNLQVVRNVMPVANGYGPWRGIQALTSGLPGVCRGLFIARHPTGVFIFAGTADRLYLLDNGTLSWDDVSLGGSAYTTLGADAHWQFAQHNNFVLATHRGVVLQRFDMGTPTTFVNCPGSPPQAGAIAIVNRFAVLADLAANPFRIHWSGLNDTGQWTAGTNLSDFQDFPDGGRVFRVAEMSQDVGLILQEGALRRMAFVPSDTDVVFAIDKLRDDTGIAGQYSLAVAGGVAYFLSHKGFVAAAVDGSMVPIGAEKVDRTFLGQSSAPVVADQAYDGAAPHMVLAAADPGHNRILWGYKSVVGTPNTIDRLLAYHTGLQRWTPRNAVVEYLAQVARPPLTLEGLDAIAPGAIVISGAANNGVGLIRLTVASTATLTTGDVRTVSGVGGTTEANGTWTLTVIDATHVDLQGSAFVNAYTSGGVIAGFLDQLPFSLDSVSTASIPGVAVVTDGHAVAFFSGPNIEAVLESAEQRAEGRRANVGHVWPRTDAATVYAYLSKRERLSDAPTATPEVAMLADGNCPVFEEGRNGRVGVRIPEGTDWTYISGVEVEAGEAGAW